jgi:hypothetical protein
MARGLTANRSPIHGRRGPGNPSDGGSFPTTPSVPAAPTFSGTLRVVDGVTYSTVTAALAASSSGDRIRLDIDISDTITVDKSIEIFSSSAKSVTSSSFGTTLTISAGVSNVYLHDFEIANSNNPASFASCITALTQTLSVPNGSTGLRMSGMTVTYPYVGAYIAADGWVINGCTFKCNTTTPGQLVYGLVNNGTANSCYLASNNFHSSAENARVTCVYHDKNLVSGYYTGHSGTMVVSGNTITYNASVTLSHFYWQRSVTPPGAAPTPIANSLNLYLTSNVISTWANGGIYRIINDAVEGLDPLSFFATLVLDGNTQGAGTVESGMLAIDKNSEAVPSVLRPTGQPTTFYARSNTFVTPLGGTWTNCSTVSGLVGCLAAHYYATNPLLVPANLGSPGTFNPSATPGLLLWYRGDSVTTSGGVVDSLVDLSTSAINATSSGAARPAYSATDAAYNNRASLTFDGTDDTITSGNVNYSNHTIFQVCRSAGQAGYRPFYRRTGAVTNDIDYCGHRTDAIFVRNNALTASYKTNAANWGVTATPITLRVQYGGTHATHLLWKNGVSVALSTGTAGDPGTLATGPLKIMSDAATFTQGTWAEYLCYSRVLTASESALVEAYLQNRYAHY